MMTPDKHGASPPGSSPRSVARLLFNVAGLLCVGLGTLGLVLPFLPATPFFLLAAFCFYRGSEALYRWLFSNRLFGERLQSYLQYRTLPFRTKVVALICLWSSIGFSIVHLENLALRLFLFAVATGVSVHLFRLRTSAGPVHPSQTAEPKEPFLQ
ncbi:MAG: YbaN family protein [Fibrobacterota bacterium]